MVTREQPIKQGRAYTAYVKVSGWAGRETDANGCSHKIVDSKIIDLKKLQTSQPKHQGAGRAEQESYAEQKGHKRPVSS